MDGSRSDSMDESTCRKLLAERDSSEWHSIPVFLTGSIRFEDRTLRLEIKRRGKRSRGGWVFLWYLLDDHAPGPMANWVVAAGTARKLIERGDILEICASTVTPAYRGMNLYQSILLELVRVFQCPVESDIAIAPIARRAWMAIGGRPAKRGDCDVLRIEPK